MSFDRLLVLHIDLNFVIVCCLWWKVELGDGLVVFEKGLVVGSGCFFFGVEGAKITLFTCTVIQKIKKTGRLFLLSISSSLLLCTFYYVLAILIFKSGFGTIKTSTLLLN